MPGLRIEGYVIVSADGMLANSKGVMPDDLKFEGDKKFFSAALDRADLIVHGRDSFEDQPNSPLRRRILLTHKTKIARARSVQSQGHVVESARRFVRSGLRAGGRRSRHRRDHRRSRRVRHVPGSLRHILAVAGAAGAYPRWRRRFPRRARAIAAADSGSTRPARRRCQPFSTRPTMSASRRGGDSRLI